MKQPANEMKKLILIFLLLIWLSPSLAADEPKRSGLLPIPAVFYTPETRIGGGASLIYFFRMPDSATETRPSNIGVLGLYTQNNQYLISGGPKLYWQNELYFANLGVAYQKWPDHFYGIGNQTHQDAEEVFTPLISRFSLEISRRWIGRLYAGPTYRYFRYSMEKKEDDGLLESGEIEGADGGLVSAVGLAITWDSRDNTFSANEGGYYRATAEMIHPAWGSDFTFNQFEVDLRHYYPIASEHILALQALFKGMTDDPPFLLLAELGGSQIMRGIYEGRYRDRSLAALQAEYRFPIWWRFSGAVFASAGDVADRLNFLYVPDFKVAAGGGLRAALNQRERIKLRIDFGVSEEDTGFYFLFSEAF